MKVFGIGLNKTGTTTLASCLRALGFRHTSCDLDLSRCAHRGDMEPIFERADQYESFEDWPWPLVYKEMDRRYVEAKFILTRRPNPEVWFSSLKRHALRTGPSEYRKIAYGYEMPHGEKDEHVRIYRSHNEGVRHHFQDRTDQLLEVCWEEGDGWEELGGFLDCPVPDADLPHEKEGRSELTSLLSYAKGYLIYRVLGDWARPDSF